MSRYRQQPIEFTALKTVPIADRGGKVRIEHFGRVPRKGMTAGEFLDGLPSILAADSLRGIISALRMAKQSGRAILWGLGGHVIKCGLAPTLIHLMDSGYVSGLVLNGAASIHDFEIGIAGCTSEDVEAVLPDGRFGAAEETGREMNEAIVAGAAKGLGMGEALGACLDEIADPRFAAHCLVLQAWRRSIPVTVHVAVGTDTPHTHPAAQGDAIGASTHQDFRLLCSVVRELHQGGVYLNVGSAVVLPEVFLKAVSVVRNLGYPLAEFTTVNLDFLQHYRPKMNVVDRPHAKAGGRGFSLTGHHEIMLPLIAAILADGEA